MNVDVILLISMFIVKLEKFWDMALSCLVLAGKQFIQENTCSFFWADETCWCCSLYPFLFSFFSRAVLWHKGWIWRNTRAVGRQRWLFFSSWRLLQLRVEDMLFYQLDWSLFICLWFIIFFNVLFSLVIRHLFIRANSELFGFCIIFPDALSVWL